MSYWCIIITDISHLIRWSPEQLLLLVDPVSDLSINLQGFWHNQHLEAPQEGITNLNDMVSICRWFGSYIQCHLPKIQGIGPSLLARPSKSKQEDWMHTFSSTTPGLGVENNLDNVWDHCSLDDQLGSISHMSRSIHTKCTSTIGLSFTTHWVKTDP